MKCTSILALVLAACAVGACSSKDSHAAQPAPKTAAKPPSQSHPAPAPTTPPAPDANAASRVPVEPKISEAPPSPLEAPPAQPAAGAEPVTGAGAGAESLLSDEDAAIPTQEEADQEASLSITEENADQELEKLEKELSEGGGG